MRQSRNKTTPANPGGRGPGPLRALLAGRSLRLTAARAAIVEAAAERHGHFPIEDLVADLKRRGIRGSKATVYRPCPADRGRIIQPAVVTNDIKSYETAIGAEHHDHLVCRGCGTVVEFEFEAFEILEREVAARHGFRLEGHLHQLFGRCSDCQAREPRPPPPPATDPGNLN